MPDAPIHQLQWSGLTHRGHVRSNNEDSFLALTYDAHEVRYLGKIGEAYLSGADFVFAVSDGMGGARSGEFASRITVDKITRLLPASFRQSAQGMATGFGDILTELFDDIHRELCSLGKSYPECEGMGATLTLAWFTPDWLYYGHIGDSRLYYLPREGGLKQLSNDDTYCGWLRRKGELNERQHRTHPRKNVLTKALGAGHQFVDPQMGAVGWEPGDRFLLCTDGVVDGLWDSNIEDLMRHQFDARSIVDAALATSGRDNTTALVIEVSEQPQ
jgi:protein phosphatase